MSLKFTQIPNPFRLVIFQDVVAGVVQAPVIVYIPQQNIRFHGVFRRRVVPAGRLIWIPMACIVDVVQVAAVQPACGDGRTIIGNIGRAAQPYIPQPRSGQNRNRLIPVFIAGDVSEMTAGSLAFLFGICPSAGIYKRLIRFSGRLWVWFWSRNGINRRRVGLWHGDLFNDRYHRNFGFDFRSSRFRCR